MGYYTTFSLHMDPADRYDEVFGYVENAGTDAAANLAYALDWASGNTGDGWVWPSETCKWYYYEDDMKELSEQFPDVVFVLHGEGEEHDDMWKHRFYNGTSDFVKATITFGEFPPLPNATLQIELED